MHKRICILIFMSLLFFSGCSSGKPTGQLIGDLSSAEESDRIKAVRWLQNRKGDAPTVVPALMESLKDVQPDVRWSAAIGLGYFGTEAKTALPALEKAKLDKDARVRNAARVAIVRIGGKELGSDGSTKVETGSRTGKS